MPTSIRYVISSNLTLFCVGLAALTFVVFATLWLSNKSEEYAYEVGQIRSLQAASNNLKDGFLNAETSQRGFILTGNEIYLSPYENAVATIKSGLKLLGQYFSKRKDRIALLARLNEIADEKLEEMNHSIQQKRSGGDAIETVRTNRGKALMDEANMLLSAVAFEAEDQATDAIAQQNENMKWLQWSSILAAIIILLVTLAGATITYRFTKEVLAARNELNTINATLETRVLQRTAELSAARDRAEILFKEVNHRVANSLSLVSSLVRMSARRADRPEVSQALQETDARIRAVAEMHRHLFTRHSDATVWSDEYLTSVLSGLQGSLESRDKKLSFKAHFDRQEMPTSVAVNLGIIATEWITNAVKYAYSGDGGEIRVSLTRAQSGLEMKVEDDGRGRDDDLPVKGSGLGTRVVSTIAGMMNAKVFYFSRDPGTCAHLYIPLTELNNARQS